MSIETTKPARRRWLTLSRALFVGAGLATLVLVLVLFFVFDTTSQAILATAARRRDETALATASRIESFLKSAESVIDRVEARLDSGVTDLARLSTVEEALHAELYRNPHLAQLSVTWRTESASAEAQVARGQVIAYRGAGPTPSTQGVEEAPNRVTGHDDAITTRYAIPQQDEFLAFDRPWSEDSSLAIAGTARRAGVVKDPTESLTFRTPLRPDLRGKAIWSDLFFLPDVAGKGMQPKAVVTVQRSLASVTTIDVVVRAGLYTDELDALTRRDTAGGLSPDLVFLCDPGGRLVTRPHSDAQLVESTDAYRFPSEGAPEPVRAALASPHLATCTADAPHATDEFAHQGDDYLVTFRALSFSQDWVVGIVVPKAFFVGDLLEARRKLLALMIPVALLGALGGLLALRPMRRELAQLVGETERMRRFEFEATPIHSTFADLGAVREGLEVSKRSMRALCKYVALDLVRDFHSRGIEPTLEAQLCEVTILFSDIADFTTVSEKLEPTRLAVALAKYLETMTDAIHSTGGIVDKFIGDAVMAIWNAPMPVDGHAARACEAVLRCREALDLLFVSPAWEGLPLFRTRFGVHMDHVMVGHFGAPTRMSYTAVGDGVNLASRLEGLNKFYGTWVIVGEPVVSPASPDYLFRRLDRVAVKGKTQGLSVYELLGRRGRDDDLLARFAPFEAALAAYYDRRFAEALELLATLENDPPSDVLRRRCEHLLTSPPPPDWDGMYVAKSK